jgi:hypothetical protein
MKNYSERCNIEHGVLLLIFIKKVQIQSGLKANI